MDIMEQTEDFSGIVRGNVSALLNDHLKYTFAHYILKSLWVVCILICWLILPLIMNTSFLRDILSIVNRHEL